LFLFFLLLFGIVSKIYINMGSGIFYSRIAKTKENVKKSRFIRTLFLTGILLFSLHFNSLATPPAFVSTNPQSVSVCQDNLGGIDVSNLLSVNEADANRPLTWTVSLAPMNGTVTGSYSANATVGGTTFVPSTTFFYMPNPGVHGPDIFQVTVTNDLAETDVITILVTINEPPALTLGAFPVVCLGATTATLSFSGNTNIGFIRDIFNPGFQPWMVPAGITAVNFEALGAAGGGDSHSGSPVPGKGGRVTGMLSVVPGQTLSINVGGAGSGTTGGFNGGGNSSCFGSGAGCGGAGGGATDIRMNGNGLTDRVVVAGGGGGSGWDGTLGMRFGGNGGGLIAGNSNVNFSGSFSGGGTQLTFGNGATYPPFASGNPGSLGNGGNASVQGNSGAGGGGYYGGGGGVWTGGGGGSSFTDPTVASLVTHTQGFNDGDGLLALDYVIGGTYSITWDATATTDGFLPVTDDQFPTSASEFTIAIPASARPETTYNGTLTLRNNASCTSIDYPISITIKDVPVIDPVSIPDVAFCNGDLTTTVIPTLTNTSLTPSFSWTNSNIYIGIGSAGSGDVPAFAATNPGTDPITSTITYSVSADGCEGAPDSFTITINPTPKIANTITPSVCNLTVFDYPVTSLTTGATFDWVRDSVAGVSTPSATGTGNPNEVLVNTTNSRIYVNYVYTVTANSCVNIETVTVTANPTLILASSHTPPALCNNDLFNYTPVSAYTETPVTFDWIRPTVPGLTNTTNSGSGNPNENLENVYTDSIAVTYIYTLTANGCSNNDPVTVVVYPSPVLSSSHLEGPICSGSLFSYAPTSLSPGLTFQWARGTQAGITENGFTNTGNISEALHVNVGTPVTVIYEYSLYFNSNNTCFNKDTLRVIMNPAPGLTSPLNASQCNNTLFNYMPTTAASGAVFTWIRGAVTGISNPPLSGIGGISETLVNTTDTVKTVAYAFITSSAGGCVNNNDTVRVVVKPNPQLSSTLTPTAVCDSSGFTYIPTSKSTAATFSWSRAYVAGISNPAATGTGSVNELLENPTNVDVDLDYVFVTSAFGCTGTPQNVHVRVKPRPKISSPLHATICSGTPFSYTPTSFTAGTRFDWTRPIVPDLDPETAFGTGSILETLISSIPTLPITTVYNYRLTANGCVNNNVQRLIVTVNGTPPTVNIVTATPSGICSQSLYQNFGASVPAPENVRYDWKGFNAAIHSVNSTRQFALVSFLQTGTAYVEITSTVLSTGCITKNSLQFDVYPGIADNPRVVYYNGQFVCLQTDVDSYQWGYDDASTLTSVKLEGQVNEHYNNSNPDWKNKFYWVVITHNGCTSKSYFIVPTGIEDMHESDVATLKLFPNPANDQINVEINSSSGGKMQVEVLNMVGQKLNMVTAVNNKAGIDVTGLPAGCYLVNCYSDGVKVASSRFIKN
jgi:hypothetical protein